MDLRSLTRSSALYSLGSIAARAVGFLMIPLYTHYLSPKDYGTLELIEMVTAVTAITFGLMALGGAMTRVYHDKLETEWQNSVVSTAVIGAAGIVTSASVLGMLASPLLAVWVFGGAEHASLLRLTFASLVVSNLMEVGLGYMRIRDRAMRYVAICFLHLVIALCLNILFIVGMGWGLWGFVLSKLITSGIGCVYLIGSVLREVGVRWNPEAARRMVRFGSPLIFGGVSLFIVHFSNRFFVGEFQGLAWVGVFALAYKFGFLISDLVGGPFTRAWSAQFYELTHHKGWEKRFADVFGALFFVVLTAWTGLSMFIPEIVTVMAAPEYHEAATFVPLIALGYAARTFGDFFADILLINRRSFARASITTLSAVASTALNMLLIPRFGVWGASFATLGTWVLFLGVSWRQARREFALPLRYGTLGLLMLVAGVTYAVSILVRPDAFLLRVAWKTMLGLGALLLTWRLDFWTPAQREAIRAMGTRVLGLLRRRPATNSPSGG